MHLKISIAKMVAIFSRERRVNQTICHYLEQPRMFCGRHFFIHFLDMKLPFLIQVYQRFLPTGAIDNN